MVLSVLLAIGVYTVSWAYWAFILCNIRCRGVSHSCRKCEVDAALKQPTGDFIWLSQGCWMWLVDRRTTRKTVFIVVTFGQPCRVQKHRKKFLLRSPRHFMASRQTFLVVFQENAGLVVPWLIGILTFISFEALGLVYANVLKDQIFGVSETSIRQSCRSLRRLSLTHNFRHHLWIQQDP